jgi:hypothetical protein
MADRKKSPNTANIGLMFSRKPSNYLFLRRNEIKGMSLEELSLRRQWRAFHLLRFRIGTGQAWLVSGERITVEQFFGWDKW